MDLKKLKSLIELFEASSITELEVEEGGEKIRISRTNEAIAHPTNVVTVPSAPQVEQVPLVLSDVQSLKTEEIITSPMVGTFYSSPDPTKPPFLKVGDTIKVGQVLCIIEAMKLMNEVTADKAGKIKEILVENGQPVEYGQNLFSIEAA